MKQLELALELGRAAAVEEQPIRLSAILQEAMERWSNAVAEVIEGIGPPGDFGYGTKRGDALHRLINIVDSFYALKCGRAQWTDRKRLRAIVVTRESVNAVAELSWPRDVRNRLPRFYTALDGLQRETELLARQLELEGELA